MNSNPSKLSSAITVGLLGLVSLLGVACAAPQADDSDEGAGGGADVVNATGAGGGSPTEATTEKHPGNKSTTSSTSTGGTKGTTSSTSTTTTSSSSTGGGTSSTTSSSTGGGASTSTTSSSSTGGGASTSTGTSTGTATTTTTAALPANNCAALGLGTTYDIGSTGATYATIGAFPWSTLKPCDVVNIHWRATPYTEKLFLGTSGLAGEPITVRGVAGPSGQLPVIDGRGATTSAQFKSYDAQYRQPYGVVYIGGPSPGKSASYVTVANLEVRGAIGQYTDATGSTGTYASDGAAVYVFGSSHIVISGCSLHDSGDGIFVNSNELSQDILIRGNYIYNGGAVGSYLEHGTYTEALGVTYEYNHFGARLAGSNGSQLKDRSAGTVIRYNQFDCGGARTIDLVDSEASTLATIKGAASYSSAFVYGNVIFNCGSNGSGDMIHWGGDSGTTANYHNGTLYFYDNTVVIRSNQKDLYRLDLFDLPTSAQSVDLRNNLIYATSETAGLAASNVYLMMTTGSLKASTNWVSPAVGACSDMAQSGCSVSGTSAFLKNTSNDPGFTNLAGGDVHLKLGAQAIGGGIAQALSVGGLFDVVSQYSNQAGVTRLSTLDLGAYGFAL